MVACVQRFVCPECEALYIDEEEAFQCCNFNKEDAIGPRRWLQEFIKEINSQDNRMTATPYYYDLRYVEGHEKRVEYDNNVFFTEKAAEEYIKANAHNLPEGTYAFLCWGGRNPELQMLLESVGSVVGVPYARK